MIADIVARARALVERATPGPWVVWKGHAEVFAGPVDENSPGAVRGYRGKICECEDLDWGEAQDGDNARLIAAAPTLLGELCDEVERLRAEREKLRAACKAIIRAFPRRSEESPIAKAAGPLHTAEGSGLYHTGKAEAILAAVGVDPDGFDEPLDSDDWAPRAPGAGGEA